MINQLGHTEINLSLERVKRVGQILDVLDPAVPVITVGGTNGKGSTVAALDAIYRTAGFSVGTFTSPILLRHNEYVRINGKLATDQTFCDAYQVIDQARAGIRLTPFEFHALAAFWIFKSCSLDVCLLEVGLGGRFDAVNAIDPHLAIVTNVDLDHMAFLGRTREAIGYEKAGIMRHSTPVVCGDLDPPQSLLEVAKTLSAPSYTLGRQFKFHLENTHWHWSSRLGDYTELPFNSLALPNMATALMAIKKLQDRLPVSHEVIKNGLSSAYVPGRIEIIPGDITMIFDVAHNPASTKLLAETVSCMPCTGKTIAVFSMLADKDLPQCIREMKAIVDQWFVAPLLEKRGANDAQLREAFAEVRVKGQFFNDLHLAYQAAREAAQSLDRIIIFGSFRTVATLYHHRH